MTPERLRGGLCSTAPDIRALKIDVAKFPVLEPGLQIRNPLDRKGFSPAASTAMKSAMLHPIKSKRFNRNWKKVFPAFKLMYSCRLKCTNTSSLSVDKIQVVWFCRLYKYSSLRTEVRQIGQLTEPGRASQLRMQCSWKTSE